MIKFANPRQGNKTDQKNFIFNPLIRLLKLQNIFYIGTNKICEVYNLF